MANADRSASEISKPTHMRAIEPGSQRKEILVQSRPIIHVWQ